MPQAVLRAAAIRVANRLGAVAPPAEAKQGLHEAISALAVSVGHVRQGGSLDVDSALATPLGRRLLGELRREVLGELLPRGGRPETVIPYVMAFEEVDRALSPTWDREFAERLAEPEGLELVVEVAHDLRSPLTSILFLAETLQRGQSGEVNDLQRRQLGLIYSAALGLSQLSSNVMELARGGTRLADDKPSPFSVSDLLDSVHDIVRPMAEEKGLTVRVLPPAGDHRIGHGQALSRVLLNLTTNALKFTQEGFIELTARATSLTRVEFAVRDTGPGIPEQALKALYQPFRERSNSSTHAFSGTGVGLALSRKLVEIMGGALKVETRTGWGTRFFFELELPPGEEF